MSPYKARHFSIQELAHPKIIAEIGETNTWMRINMEVIWDIDLIRDIWFNENGSGIYCNRLNLGIDSRGLRPPDDPDGSFYSSHKQGTAFDLEPVNGKHEEFWHFVRDLIRRQDSPLQVLNTLETIEWTPTWCHVAYMNHDNNLLIISP